MLDASVIFLYWLDGVPSHKKQHKLNMAYKQQQQKYQSHINDFFIIINSLQFFFSVVVVVDVVAFEWSLCAINLHDGILSDSIVLILGGKKRLWRKFYFAAATFCVHGLMNITNNNDSKMKYHPTMTMFLHYTHKRQ